MTTVTTISIILTAVLAFLLGRSMYISSRRATLISNQKAKINRYRLAADDLHPLYTVRRIDADDSAHEYNGVWAVCRTSCQDGYIHNSCIKIFTDEDDEFNKNEAVELCDKLNEK